MQGNARRVLVLEDDPETAEQLVDCLRTSGYTVDVASIAPSKAISPTATLVPTCTRLSNAPVRSDDSATGRRPSDSSSSIGPGEILSPNVSYSAS